MFTLLAAECLHPMGFARKLINTPTQQGIAIILRNAKEQGMKDGIYFEVFAMQDGKRYNAKIIDVKDASMIMANSVMDALGKVVGFEDTAHPTEKGNKK